MLVDCRDAKVSKLNIKQDKKSPNWGGFASGFLLLLSALSLIKNLNNSCVLCYLFEELIELWGGFLSSTFSLNLNLMGKEDQSFSGIAMA